MATVAERGASLRLQAWLSSIIRKTWEIARNRMAQRATDEASGAHSLPRTI